MEGFMRQQLASSKVEDFSSGILENDQTRNTAGENLNMTQGFWNTAIEPLMPLDSQLPHASTASSANSFSGYFLSDGSITATDGHQFDSEATMLSDHFHTIGSADAFSLHGQDTNSRAPLVSKNFGILPIQQQQNLPSNRSVFQQNSLHNLATPFDAVQLDGTDLLTDYLKENSNIQGSGDALLDLTSLATQSNGEGMAMPSAAIAGHGHSEIQSLGGQTGYHGSEQQNVVISGKNSSSCNRNVSRRFVVPQSGTVAEGCSMPISDSHVIASHPLSGHADMYVSHYGQHTLQGTSFQAGSLDGHSPLEYEVTAYERMLLNIHQNNWNDPNHFFRTSSEIHIDSCNMRSGITVTPSLQSPLISQLRPLIYPQALSNEKPSPDHQMYHQRVQAATPSSCSTSHPRVQMATPASSTQPIQNDYNFSDISLATASQGGSAFPGRTDRAGEGRAYMNPQISIENSDVTEVPKHKRKMHPPSCTGDVIGGKTQQNVSAVNFSPAGFVPPSTDQNLVSPQMSQQSRYRASIPGSVNTSMPAAKQQQVVPPQSPCAAVSRPRIPTPVHQPASSARSLRNTQQQVTTPLSSTRRRPIHPLHASAPRNHGNDIPSPASEPKRSKATPLVDFNSHKAHEPLGHKCWVCKRDVSYAPEDPLRFPAAPLPVAVLPCGHVFHGRCLLALTPKGHEKDPFCIPCAIGERQASPSW